MNTTKNPTTLEKLLQRGDIWRGSQQPPSHQPSVDTGYQALNAQLIHRGWPCACLIEICQPAPGHGDWLLLTPTLQLQLQKHPHSHVILLNPPALPFCQGLMQAGISVQQILLVRTNNKADFIASFVEVARASSCCLLLAWQPRQTLSYTELRKCQLAATNSSGLYMLFRPSQTQQQSSPASLRLSSRLKQNGLSIDVIKQRGQLYAPEAVILPLPENWQAIPPHRHLGRKPSKVANDRLFTGYQPRQNITPLSIHINAANRARLKWA